MNEISIHIVAFSQSQCSRALCPWCMIAVNTRTAPESRSWSLPEARGLSSLLSGMCLALSLPSGVSTTSQLHDSELLAVEHKDGDGYQQCG